MALTLTQVILPAILFHLDVCLMLPTVANIHGKMHFEPFEFWLAKSKGLFPCVSILLLEEPLVIPYNR